MHTMYNTLYMYATKLIYDYKYTKSIIISLQMLPLFISMRFRENRRSRGFEIPGNSLFWHVPDIRKSLYDSRVAISTQFLYEEQLPYIYLLYVPLRALSGHV